MSLELQFVPTKPSDTFEWIFPTVGFELCRRETASYFTFCIFVGRAL